MPCFAHHSFGNARHAWEMSGALWKCAPYFENTRRAWEMSVALWKSSPRFGNAQRFCPMNGIYTIAKSRVLSIREHDWIHDLAVVLRQY